MQTHSQPFAHAHDPLLTPAEVARRLGKSGQTIRRWIRAGLLPAVRFPSGRTGVRQSQADRLLRAAAEPCQPTFGGENSERDCVKVTQSA